MRKIQERDYFPRFDRHRYDNYDLQHQLSLVEAIGKSRNPKFAIDQENRFAYENFIRWCHADTAMKALHPMSGEVQRGDINRGIYLAGNTGTGKSWCLEIMLAYVRTLGFQIKSPDEKAPRPLFWKTYRADDICHHFAKEGDIPHRKIAILGIQDLGQEPLETLHMGNRLNVLQQLLECRGDRCDRLTLITSNLRISSETLKRNYGDRVQSRLVEMCNYLEIKGRDRRNSFF